MRSVDLLRQNIESMHNDLVLGYERTKKYPSAVVGAEREILIEKLLSVVLPSITRFGSGIIIDHEGRSTGQVDLIIESPYSTSFPVSSDKQRLYFADSVMAAFEVKSDLSKQKEQAFNKTDEIMSLWTKKLNEDENPELKNVINKQDYEIPSFIISFKGATKETVNNWLYEECRKHGRRYPTGILCIEPGYFFGFTPSGQHDLQAEGHMAIYAFICCLNTWIQNKANSVVEDSLYIDLLNNTVNK